MMMLDRLQDLIVKSHASLGQSFNEKDAKDRAWGVIQFFGYNDQVLVDQCFLDFSSSFLRRSFTSSETDLYPSSGCSFTSFSISSKRGFGILAELYCGTEEIYMYKNKNVDVTYMWQHPNRCKCLEHICNIGVAV